MIKTFSGFLLLFFFLTYPSYAQPTLPELQIQKEQGTIILSWINPYTTGIKAVEIERTTSEYGDFTLIGRINKLEKESQTFVDAHPLLGENFYRVKVTFSSNVEWLSNTISYSTDSLDKKKSQTLPSTDSIQVILNAMNGNLENIKEVIKPAYPVSKWVFTNPFTNNINIEIPDAKNHNYSLEFFTLNDLKVMEISRIRESILILDKRNFQNLGVYKFIIKKNQQVFEEGFITIN